MENILILQTDDDLDNCIYLKKLLNISIAVEALNEISIKKSLR